MMLMHSFCTLHIRILGRLKITVINSNMIINERKVTLCNNNDQTWFSDTLTSARPLRVVLKPSPFRLGFQHHPRGPADVNA